MNKKIEFQIWFIVLANTFMIAQSVDPSLSLITIMFIAFFAFLLTMI